MRLLGAKEHLQHCNTASALPKAEPPGWEGGTHVCMQSSTCIRRRTTSRGYATVCPVVPAMPPQASRVAVLSSRSSFRSAQCVHTRLLGTRCTESDINGRLWTGGRMHRCQKSSRALA